MGDVRRFEVELLEFVRTRHADLLEQVRTTGTLPEGDVLEEAVQRFKELFTPSDGSGPSTPGGGDAPRTDAASAGEGGAALVGGGSGGGAGADGGAGDLPTGASGAGSTVSERREG